MTPSPLRIVDPIRVLLIGGHSYLGPGRVRPKGSPVPTGLSMPPSWAARGSAGIGGEPPDTSLFDGDPIAAVGDVAGGTVGLVDAGVLRFRDYDSCWLSCEVALTYASELDDAPIAGLRFGRAFWRQVARSAGSRRRRRPRWLHTRQHCACRP